MSNNSASNQNKEMNWRPDGDKVAAAGPAIVRLAFFCRRRNIPQYAPKIQKSDQKMPIESDSNQFHTARQGRAAY
jgi:hypothetical protein